MQERLRSCNYFYRFINKKFKKQGDFCLHSIIVPIFNNACGDCKSGFKYLDVKYINERQKYFTDLEFSGNTSTAEMKLYFNLYIISTKYKDIINLCIKYKI